MQDDGRYCGLGLGTSGFRAELGFFSRLDNVDPNWIPVSEKQDSIPAYFQVSKGVIRGSLFHLQTYGVQYAADTKEEKKNTRTGQ